MLNLNDKYKLLSSFIYCFFNIYYYLSLHDIAGDITERVDDDILINAFPEVIKSALLQI